MRRCRRELRCWSQGGHSRDGSPEPFRQRWTELTADQPGSDRVAVELKTPQGIFFFFSFEFLISYWRIADEQQGDSFQVNEEGTQGIFPECAAIPGSFQNQGLVVQEIWVGPDETEISGACTVGILRLTVGLNVRHRWGRGRKAQHLSSFSRKACLLICR